MTINIVVPALGESVVEATVAEWLKKEGDAVAVGEALVRLETDKVDLEVGAEQAGVLTQIAQPQGADVQVGQVLGVLNAADESTAADPPSAPRADDKATPVARRVAQEVGVDVSRVTGSGPGGRVTRRDVEGFVARPQPEPPAAAIYAPPPQPAPVAPSARSAADVNAGDGRRVERVRMTRRRQTIARRLVEAQQTAAMLTTFNEVDMSAVMDIRNRRKDSFKEQHGVGLGFMSFFTKAVIAALKAFPRLNAEIEGDEIITKHYYDIGVAIGAAEGLVVPVLRDADRMTFAQIEQAIKDFAQKVDRGTLTLDDLRGGTFTITNGGVFGSLLSTPILNAPQVGILGMHKIEPRPVVISGQIVIRPMMYLALSYDHRIVDGREAVQFLVKVKQLIEDPEALLLEA
jgi:2-oxoglutarate dehydrogenase E2 component (dihydrolipoamide succinyltransferase)